MPSDYTGDGESAVNDPVGAPEPGRAPQGSLPLDTEDLNVASVYAAFKSAFDWIDWLRYPFAKLVDYATPTKAYRNAKKQKRWGVDHMGMPAGRLIHERIVPLNNYSVGADAEVSAGDFEYKTVGTGSAISSGTPDKYGRTLSLGPGNSAGNYAVWKTQPYVAFDDDVQIAMEWVGQLNPSNTGKHFAGISDAFSSQPSTNILGCFFEANETDANIQAVASGASKVNTTIAKGSTIRRFRIEFYGEQTDENGTPARRALFYIDGVQRAEITGFSSVVESSLAAAYFATENVSGQPTLTINSPILFNANTFPGDVF